jgi:hypothetical protein
VAAHSRQVRTSDFCVKALFGLLEAAFSALLSAVVLTSCATRNPCAADMAQTKAGKYPFPISDECAAHMGSGYKELSDLVVERDQLCLTAIKNGIDLCEHTIDSTPECMQAIKVGEGALENKDCNARVMSGPAGTACINWAPCAAMSLTDDPDKKDYYARLCMQTAREQDPVCKEANERVKEQSVRVKEEAKNESQERDFRSLLWTLNRPHQTTCYSLDNYAHCSEN